MNSPRPNDFISPKAACRRCGTCCRRGGPILHVQDLEFVDDIRLCRQDLVCLRPGEIGSDPFTNSLIRLQTEHLKLRGADAARGDWRCAFFSQAGCRLHPRKPLQCRLLDCARPEALARALASEPLLTRADLLVRGSALAELWRLHEEHFPVRPPLDRLLADLARETPPARALARLADAIGEEAAFRLDFASKTQAPQGFLDFLFGRPLGRLLKDAASLGPSRARDLLSGD